jgi:hypothetical protein
LGKNCNSIGSTIGSCLFSKSRYKINIRYALILSVLKRKYTRYIANFILFFKRYFATRKQPNYKEMKGVATMNTR